MLGIAALAFVFAYGRMAKSFTPRVFMVLAIIALLMTYLSALILGVRFDGRVVLPAILQFVLQLALFWLGGVLGRWRDRDKELE